MGNDSKNQGEGDKEAAERYNKNAEEFARSERGKKAIDTAGDMTRQEQREAEKAEQEGLARAKEKDPQVTRNYDKSDK